MLNKTQNVVLRWISGAFRTTPILWLEYLMGVPPVQQKANYMLHNALQRTSHLPRSHILNHMAAVLVTHLFQDHRYGRRPPQDNIWLLKTAVQQHPPLALHDLITRIGNRLLDCTTQLHITILAAPS